MSLSQHQGASSFTQNGREFTSRTAGGQTVYDGVDPLANTRGQVRDLSPIVASARFMWHRDSSGTGHIITTNTPPAGINWPVPGMSPADLNMPLYQTGITELFDIRQTPEHQNDPDASFIHDQDLYMGVRFSNMSYIDLDSWLSTAHPVLYVNGTVTSIAYNNYVGDEDFTRGAGARYNFNASSHTCYLKGYSHDTNTLGNSLARVQVPVIYTDEQMIHTSSSSQNDAAAPDGRRWCMIDLQFGTRHGSPSNIHTGQST